MPSKQERVRLYYKAMQECGQNIQECTPAFFYGSFCHTLATHPEKLGLPSHLGKSKKNKQWTYKLIVDEVCRLIWDKPFHPRSSPALKWPNLGYAVLSRLCLGVPVTSVINGRFNYGMSLTKKECLELITELNKSQTANLGPIYCSAYGDISHPDWFLIWRHIPNVNNYFRARSRKILDYIIRHKEYFQKDFSRADEIFDTDITNLSLKPEHLFERIDDRKNPKVNFPPFPYVLPPEIVYISDSRALKKEGERMHHCVLSYSHGCQRGECFILSLPNSTAEIRANGNVAQHRGNSNRTPPQEDIELLRKWSGNKRRKDNL